MSHVASPQSCADPVEHDHAAGHLAALHGSEALVDVFQPDATRHHIVEVQPALHVELDFTAVSQVAYQPTIIVGRTELPYKNIKEMVDYARANPGAINRGSPGAAILSNLAPVAFEKSLGIRTNHIPFNGDAPAIQAMLSNSIDVYGTSITSSLPHIKSGKFRVLGVMDTKRLPQVPEALTFKELGYEFEAPLRYYLSAPAATPKDVVSRLNKSINDVLADPAFIERARAIGMEPQGGTPEDMERLLNAEIARWNPVVKSLNLPKAGQ
ncbi:tripartite-type tricarboxylate transporter receptor subunit TctC [Variovorax boronicumulans]|uniref:Bug family tripartite tricarboxylate transporter substrate binding protein n=1 Tax=Variovorax boronicumulans TaxID=436515 RepID=UPI00277D6A82|nr:tripartite tricarboxylate transporter substrate-binding protein [Variovorax boronicumulans]MDQ0036052.1 tripartite-type tricarboxylate transporter receptor subunit TctC [Variovorax boronicumulans]